MEKLYEIQVTYYAQKGSHTSIQEYIVANSDKDVFDYLAKGYAQWKEVLEYWEDYDYESEEEAIKEYEEIYNNKGDYRDVYDLYYGATQYYWREVELVDDLVINLMIKNKLAKEI